MMGKIVVPDEDKSVTIDPSLSNPGQVADAKATGDAIREEVERAKKVENEIKNDINNRFASQNILIGSETGNPLSVDDAFAAPLCGLSVYGRSTQDGEPSPDNPVPIVSAGDSGSVAVKVTGKNLIQPYEKDTQIAKNGVTMDYNVASQLVHVYGTATEVASIYDARQEIPLFIKSNVTMSLTVTAGKIPDGVIIQYSDFVTLGLSCTGSKPYDTGAFSKTDAPGYVKFAMNVPSGTTVDFTIAVQLELGSTATTYSPYHEQLLTLPTPNGLPGIPVTSGGNYTDQSGQQWVCDEVDLERGVKVQRIYTVDIAELEYSASTILQTVKRIFYKISMPSTGTTNKGYCTRLTYSANYSADNPHFYINEERIVVFIPLDTTIKPKEYLVQYVLASPIETPLTPAEIAAYKALTTYGPDTVVQAGDGAGIKLDYQRDVNIAIKKLEDAIASMT